MMKNFILISGILNTSNVSEHNNENKNNLQIEHCKQPNNDLHQSVSNESRFAQNSNNNCDISSNVSSPRLNFISQRNNLIRYPPNYIHQPVLLPFYMFYPRYFPMNIPRNINRNLQPRPCIFYQPIMYNNYYYYRTQPQPFILYNLNPSYYNYNN
ncbi:hypothetical protein HERIO_1076 [Hepatospora eriocheir]|uniref:Uncharacterized protein n=1 Tax=Hepatospora eriocheir TaxID=1081669 RepID=A0A1X0QB56_9MICR|nr:hypothetical protein HERIO_1076 [Hepatospora eriocheir]